MSSYLLPGIAPLILRQERNLTDAKAPSKATESPPPSPGSASKAPADCQPTSSSFETKGGESKGGLVESKGGLVESKSGLVESKSGLVESKGGLVESKSGLVESKGGLVESKGGLVESKGGLVTASVSDADLKVAESWAEVVESLAPTAESKGALSELKGGVGAAPVLSPDFEVVESKSVETKGDSGPRNLRWADEFNVDGKPDASKWSHVVKPRGWVNNELQEYTDSEKNAFVKDGVLHLQAVLDEKPTHEAAKPEPRPFGYHWGGGRPLTVEESGKFSSARLVTLGHADFAYGRVEVRAKLPNGVGTWPAIWMLPSGNRHDEMSWPDDGELDIMEHVGFNPNVIHGSAHTGASNWFDGTGYSTATYAPNVTSDYHVYAVEWRPDRIEWTVDNKPFKVLDRPKNATYEQWPFDQPFHLILNVAVGGDWGANQGVDWRAFADKDKPQEMLVDYVRVYDLSPDAKKLAEEIQPTQRPVPVPAWPPVSPAQAAVQNAAPSSAPVAAPAVPAEPSGPAQAAVQQSATPPATPTETSSTPAQAAREQSAAPATPTKLSKSPAQLAVQQSAPAKDVAEPAAPATEPSPAP